MHLLTQVNDLMQHLNVVSQTPTLALPEVAQVVTSKLGVALCSISCITGGGGAAAGGASAVLLAAHGSGAAALQEVPVARGAEWSSLQLREATGVLHVRSAVAAAAGSLPRDFELVHASAGLKSFMAVPIAAGPRVLGALMVAKEAEGGFDEAWWQLMLAAVANSVLQHLRNVQVSYLCSMMAVLDATPSVVELVSCLLHGVARFMLATTNIRMGVRLGLADLADQEALLLERAPKGPAEPPSCPGPTFTPPLLGSAVVATPVGLQNTLLSSTMLLRKPRCIKDCANYFQSCIDPAADVFTPASQLVAAVVVVPVCHGAAVLGGIYLTLDAPGNFAQVQDPIVGLVARLSGLLHQRLSGQFGTLRQLVAPARNSQDSNSRWSSAISAAAAASESSANSFGAGAPPAGAGGSLWGGGAGDAAAAGAGAGQPAALVQAGGRSFSLATAANKSMCTEAIMKAVQQKLITSHAVVSGGAEQQEDLVLESVIGRGGFGVCYKAIYNKGPAVVKVLYARQHEREAMKDAVEMAVLSCTQHAHVIQVYACLNNMVEEPINPGAGGGAGVLPRYRRALPGEEGRAASCSLIVMEFMDMGTLRDAIKRGSFHRRVSPTAMAVDLTGCIKVLREVGQAVEHLHSRNLLHCDIKSENVLLKTDATRPLGFVCKLADFGLVKLIRGSKQYVVNCSGTGTITHLAPEGLLAGSRLTTAVDVFSFGILMYELYSGQRAYTGLTTEEIINRVVRNGARPSFPPGTPEGYVSLAQRCWAADPAARPQFSEVVPTLEAILANVAAMQPKPAATAAAAPAAQQQQQQQQLAVAAAAAVAAGVAGAAEAGAAGAAACSAKAEPPATPPLVEQL